MKLINKYVIGTHVMFYEIEMVTEHIDSILNATSQIDNKENITIKLWQEYPAPNYLEGKHVYFYNGRFARHKRISVEAVYKTEWFKDLSIYKNNKIMDPIKRIAEETEEDYQILEKILNDADVKTYRSFLDIDKVGSLKNIFKPPINPRDHFAVIGEKIYACSQGVPVMLIY